ncbi:hypothetical protein PG995_000259 [Apiospora arundinis]
MKTEIPRCIYTGRGSTNVAATVDHLLDMPIRATSCLVLSCPNATSHLAVGATAQPRRSKPAGQEDAVRRSPWPYSSLPVATGLVWSLHVKFLLSCL